MCSSDWPRPRRHVSWFLATTGRAGLMIFDMPNASSGALSQPILILPDPPARFHHGVTDSTVCAFDATSTAVRSVTQWDTCRPSLGGEVT
jgi:hypothetical protein